MGAKTVIKIYRERKKKKIFIAYLIKKFKIPKKQRKRKQEEEREAPVAKSSQGLFPPSPSVTALALTFGAGVSAGLLTSVWPRLR